MAPLNSRPSLDVVDPHDPFLLQPPPTTDMRIQLQSLLDEKEKQLQLAGTLGQKILAQQMELEERINQFSQYEQFTASSLDDAQQTTEVRQKIQELMETMQTWEAENEQLWGGLTSKLTNGPSSARPPHTPITPSSSPGRQSIRDLPPPDADMSMASVTSTGPSAAQSSRRAKNAAHRPHDAEFAFEIGHSLITEVRRLQSLLGERDKALQDKQEEIDDLEKQLDSVKLANRQQEASAEKFKEENWNLEVTTQELRTQLLESQQDAARGEQEAKRALKQLAAAKETTDAQKSENERLSTALEDLKAKHETDVAQMRKQTAALNRDKSDLQASLDALKTEYATRERSFKRFGSPATIGTDVMATPNNLASNDDPFFTGGASRRKLDTPAFLTPGGLSSADLYFDSSPDPSPSKPSIPLAPNHPTNELEALKQSLAHAHRQINTLKASVTREKEQKLAFKRQLVQSAGSRSHTVPGAWEDDVEEEDEDESVPAKSTPSRGRGRAAIQGRAPRILTLAQKLGLAPTAPAQTRELSEEWQDMEEEQKSPLSPLSPSSPPTVNRDLIEDDEEPDVSPSKAPVATRPASIDVNGMDPIFADILKNTDAVPVAPSNGLSPLGRIRSQRSPLKSALRGAPRRRGGAGFGRRPNSLIGAPSALSMELDGSDDQDEGSSGFHDEVLQEIEEIEKVETVDVGIQAEPEQPIPISVPVVSVVERSEFSMQTEAPPDDAILRPEMVDQGCCTDDVPAPATPILVNTSTETDPEVIAPVPVPPIKSLSHMDIQTDEFQPDVREVEIQTSPLPEVLPVEISTMVIQREVIDLPEDLTIQIPDTGADERVAIPRPRVLSIASTRSPRPVAMIFEDPETETDGEYLDARETPGFTPTPLDSVSDFHSAMGGSSVDGSERDEESDAESIRTSRMATGDGYASLSAQNLSAHRRKISVISNATSRPVILSSKSVETVEPPKPEMKEVCIQTDQWEPLPAVNTLPVPPSPVFQRVGSTTSSAPPFQYITTPSKEKSFTSSGTATSTVPVSLAPIPRPSSPKGTKGILRDSVGTFGGSLPRRSQTPSGSRTDRRPSIESAFSQGDDLLSRPVAIPMPPPPVDRTKPPTMMLPPPPSMPPPAIIPVKKPAPPPRPTSPPPPELIQRATTPTFGRSTLSVGLNVPAAGRGYIRQHGSSLPSNAQGLRQPVSTSSFRSTPHTHMNAPSHRPEQSSATSLLSGISNAALSRRASVSSSHSSELNHTTPGRSGVSNTTAAAANPGPDTSASTDPEVIHSITQTMIGEFLYKYTRPLVGKGLGEKRHKRFFWVHPYTKTLYWSNADPGASNVGESSAKSTYIDGVRSVLDPNPLPPGVHQYSIVVSTPQREMKFTAPNKERHDIWFNALNYLLARPSTVPMGPPSMENLNSPNDIRSPSQRPDHIASPRSIRSVHSTHSYSITPRAMRSQTQLSHHGSIGKRPGTPAAEYLRWADDPQSPTRSIRSYHQEQSANDDGEDFNLASPGEEATFELHDNDFEGLENVRACCDGEHDLGTLSRRPSQHHHHHHHHHHPVNQPHSRPTTPAERPISPSAWSLRSKVGSTHSDGGLFGWAGEAKRSIRFKRAKSPGPSKPGIPFARSNN